MDQSHLTDSDSAYWIGESVLGYETCAGLPMFSRDLFVLCGWMNASARGDKYIGLSAHFKAPHLMHLVLKENRFNKVSTFAYESSCGSRVSCAEFIKMTPEETLAAAEDYKV